MTKVWVRSKELVLPGARLDGTCYSGRKTGEGLGLPNIAMSSSRSLAERDMSLP